MKIHRGNLLAILFLSFTLVASVTAPAAANGPGVCGPGNFAGGDGSQAHPFQIYDQNSLNELRDCGTVQHYYYILNNDIVLSGNWTPIPSFDGTIDGNNKTISAIDILVSQNYAGLFGFVINADIKNLSVSGTVMNDGEYTGLLVGASENSEFTNISGAADVTGYIKTGGLFGEVYESSIVDVSIEGLTENSQVLADGDHIGGIVGRLEDSDIDQSRSTINLTGTNWLVGMGGIAGSTVRNSPTEYEHSALYYSGVIENFENGAYRCGGIIGQADYPVVDVIVEEATINCESHDVGGAVGFSIESVTNAKVSADVIITPADEYLQPAAVGGVVGNWMPILGTSSITKSSFNGYLTAEVFAGGVIGVLDGSYIDSSVTIETSQNYASSDISNTLYAGGIIGGVIDQDAYRDAYPKVGISESYASTNFYNISDNFDAIALSDNELVLENVVWNKNGSEAITTYEDSISASLDTMKRPGFWKNIGWNMTSTWGMSTETNDGLPVLRAANDVNFNIVCEVKKAPAIKFAKNSSKLDAKARSMIEAFATKVLDGNCISISFAGYASGKEVKKRKKKNAWQMELSQNRLNAVVTFFNLKIDSSEVDFQIIGSALGAKNKKNRDKTKTQQAANRRVEVGTIS